VTRINSKTRGRKPGIIPWMTSHNTDFLIIFNNLKYFRFFLSHTKVHVL
jgi:hypothetical protein